MPYIVKVSWQNKSPAAFLENKYSRAHTWSFDGGIELAASSSPHVVPVPMSDESAVDPEEAFVASLSSCHMLWFLSIAAEKKYAVASYEDSAVGVLGKDGEGRLAMTKVTLNPKTEFIGENIPSRQQIEELHQLAHAKCFIANSVKTQLSIKQA